MLASGQWRGPPVSRALPRGPTRGCFPLSRSPPATEGARLTADTIHIRPASAGGASVRDPDIADPELAWRSINTIRVLAMDAVEAAQSGHPGTPMALAPA